MNSISQDAQNIQLMTFRVGGHELGVDIMAVREIRVWTEPMPLPHMPGHVRGVINLRGQVLPIIDLSAQLGWGTTEPTPTHVYIVLLIGDQLQGMIVDAVSDILTVGAAELRPAPSGDRTRGQEIIKGIITTDTHMVTVLDLDRLPNHALDLDMDLDLVA